MGKAQEVYSALSLEDSQDYDKVKAAILKSYELVPEAYLQRFWGFSKLVKQTCVEFTKEKEMLFHRWCNSQSAETKEDLRQLILLEHFKYCLPNTVCTYLNEHRVETLDRAPVLAGEFVLMHKQSFEKDPGEQQRKDTFHRTFPSLPLPVLIPGNRAQVVSL